MLRQVRMTFSVAAAIAAAFTIMGRGAVAAPAATAAPAVEWRDTNRGHSALGWASPDLNPQCPHVRRRVDSRGVPSISRGESTHRVRKLPFHALSIRRGQTPHSHGWSMRRTRTFRRTRIGLAGATGWRSPLAGGRPGSECVARSAEQRTGAGGRRLPRPAHVKGTPTLQGSPDPRK